MSRDMRKLMECMNPKNLNENSETFEDVVEYMGQERNAKITIELEGAYSPQYSDPLKGVYQPEEFPQLNISVELEDGTFVDGHDRDIKLPHDDDYYMEMLSPEPDHDY